MASTRSTEKWESNLRIAKDLCEIAERNKDDRKYLEQLAVSLRNPLMFDNDTRETSSLLEYKIPNPGGLEETKDHLLGISNAVLYIFKSQLYKGWNNVEDFKRTIEAVNVTVVCPVALNNGGFKTWLFEWEKVDLCIQWNEKLKAHGINYLVNDKGETKLTDVVWCEWHFKYKKYLV